MKSFLIILFLLCSTVINAQYQERKVLIYNVALGGLASGIGAVINKPKDTKWTKCFIRGLWQGSIGGLLNYSGKKTTYLITKNRKLWYAWPAKILHFSGNSIIENASLNNPFLQNWNVHIGFVRVDFFLGKTKELKYRLLPFAAYNFSSEIIKNKIDLSTSLEVGTFVFQEKGHNEAYWAYSLGGTVTYLDTLSYYKPHIIAHELIHEFQYKDYFFFNSYLKPLEPKKRLKKAYEILAKYIYLDVPYFLPFYYLEGTEYKGDQYYRNFYEFEADKFATNKEVYIE